MSEQYLLGIYTIIIRESKLRATISIWRGHICINWGCVWVVLLWLSQEVVFKEQCFRETASNQSIITTRQTLLTKLQNTQYKTIPHILYNTSLAIHSSCCWLSLYSTHDKAQMQVSEDALRVSLDMIATVLKESLGPKLYWSVTQQAQICLGF